MKKLIICMILMLLLTGCADNVPYTLNTMTEPVGFWYGLWHGWIVGFAWICSLFSDNIAIYASYNNGGWYDFGFILGIGAFAGGSSSAAR